jgi:hypothetical protein
MAYSGFPRSIMPPGSVSRNCCDHFRRIYLWGSVLDTRGSDGFDGVDRAAMGRQLAGVADTAREAHTARLSEPCIFGGVAICSQPMS